MPRRFDVILTLATLLGAFLRLCQPPSFRLACTTTSPPPRYWATMWPSTVTSQFSLSPTLGAAPHNQTSKGSASLARVPTSVIPVPIRSAFG